MVRKTTVGMDGRISFVMSFYCTLRAVKFSTLINKEEMKAHILALGIAMGMMALPSCKKDKNSNSTKSQVEENVQSGTWRITKFIDSGTNETTYYTGYDFNFNSSGSVSASNGTQSHSGSWSISASSSDDDSQDDLDFNLSFSSPDHFEELSDDWHFISQSETKIELIDVSGGNGGTDYLTFEKN